MRSFGPDRTRGSARTAMVEGRRERGYLDDRFAILGMTQKGRVLP
jgi:hypothetical protein